MLFRAEPAVPKRFIIPRRVAMADAVLFGSLAVEDIHRAVGVQHAYLTNTEEREARIASEINAAVVLAQHAWCFALNATGYRETDCHCLIGGGHGAPFQGDR